MNKSVIYIVGATVLVGGGAFLFLKNKKAKDLSKLADIQKESGTTLGGTTSSGIAVSRVDDVLQISNSTKNAQEAVTLASQIFELKNKKSKYTNMSLSEFSKTKEGKEDFFKSNIGMVETLKEVTLKEFDRQLKILTDKIVALGYVEVNGSIAKLNL
jgi:hypothetical protein